MKFNIFEWVFSPPVGLKKWELIIWNDVGGDPSSLGPFLPYSELHTFMFYIFFSTRKVSINSPPCVRLLGFSAAHFPSLRGEKAPYSPFSLSKRPD